MTMARKALIVVNLAGFLCFLRNDFELLKSMGYEIEVAADGRMADGSEAVELPKLREAGIPFHQIDIDSKNPLSKASLGAYKQLRAVIRNGGFDFIACHTPISGLLTRVAAQRERRTRGTKVIYTTHGFAFCKGTSWKSWMVYFPMEYIMSAFCDAIVTINSEDRRNAERMLCKRVYQLPGVGVDIDRMRMDAGFDRDAYRASIGVGRDDVMVLSVGELSARKNHRVIIEALGLLPDRQRYVYIVCGRDVSGTGLAETLSRRATELGVRVRFLGHRSDIPEINNCADIAAIPSIREGLGLAGIEALAAGVPVIGSDVQGIRDYVIPRKTGYLCNPKSAKQFARSISEYIDTDIDIKQTMQKQCKKKSELYSLAKAKQALYDIYREVL